MLTNSLRTLYYQLPEELRQAILVRFRSGPDWNRVGIVFIHIPKAAGTSINESVFGRFMGHARAVDIERWGSSKLKALPRFAVTRNPWDRLVSAYRFARRGRGIGGERPAWVWKPRQYQVPECETFERFVKEWLAPRDIRLLDGIFKPQSMYVCNEQGKLLVDHVGSLENLAPTSEFLREHLGRVPAIPESNRSGTPVDYRSYYSPELIDLVGRIYEEDARRFRYTFEGFRSAAESG